MNQYYPLKGTAEGEPSNRFVRATGTEFDGRELLLGQLVYVRKDPLERHKFDAAASPALFAGWRFDSGPLSFKNAYYVLDYESVRSQKPGYSIATAVPCEEVYVPKVHQFCHRKLQQMRHLLSSRIQTQSNWLWLMFLSANCPVMFHQALVMNTSHWTDW